jgi:ribonuclease HI
MRVFTDGACSHNGRPGAKAGYAVWFPDAPALSESVRLAASDPQTNQRAELAAIHRAVVILDANGYHGDDIKIYTDSEYSMNCLTKWISGWVARGWKTAAGGDVLHRDLIQATSTLLSKFKSHRFIHVRAHTGNEDDLSKQNDVVDRMARSTIDETVKVAAPEEAVQDELFPAAPCAFWVRRCLRLRLCCGLGKTSIDSRSMSSISTSTSSSRSSARTSRSRSPNRPFRRHR